MISRRDFLKMTETALVLPWGCARWAGSQSGEVLNDVHSQLNTTRVNGVLSVSSQEDVVQALDRAARQGQAVSVVGGRHAMDAQLGDGYPSSRSTTVETIPHFDSRAGLLEVEARIQWSVLVDAYLAIQARSQPQWGFVQKQTGADRLSMAEGSLTSA